jgi:flagellar biogenesis protein FliO
LAEPVAAAPPIAGAAFASAPAAAAPAQASSAIPFRESAPEEAGTSSVAGALLICAIALGVIVLVLRRRGNLGGQLRGRGLRMIEVVESARLSDRARVSVIRYRGRELLVAHSEQAITVLDSSPLSSPAETQP